MERITHSPEETFQLARTWGEGAPAGWILGLSGDLGAGKTELVKGLACGLAIRERVHSPTFVLVNVYEEGRLPLYHLDLYRLESREAIQHAGLEEYFANREAVVVVEWIDRWVAPGQSPNPAQPYRFVRIEETGERSRRIFYEDFGP